MSKQLAIPEMNHWLGLVYDGLTIGACDVYVYKASPMKSGRRESSRCRFYAYVKSSARARPAKQGYHFNGGGSDPRPSSPEPSTFATARSHERRRKLRHFIGMFNVRVVIVYGVIRYSVRLVELAGIPSCLLHRLGGGLEHADLYAERIK